MRQLFELSRTEVKVRAIQYAAAYNVAEKLRNGGAITLRSEEIDTIEIIQTTRIRLTNRPEPVEKGE